MRPSQSRRSLLIVVECSDCCRHRALAHRIL
jgi:hypothetical protein